MNTHKLIRQLLFALIAVYIAVTIVGCSSANSISSLNPVAADPESSITLDDGSEVKTAELAPVVNVFASKTVVGPAAEIDLRAEAIDPAGGQIDLSWEANTGTIISTSGSKAVWQAPSQTSIANITCIATDVRGKSTKAELSIEVIGNSMYRLVINADRSSILTSRITGDVSNPYVPVAGARVEMQGLGDIGLTDAAGMVEFNIDQSSRVASYAQVVVKYLDWEISYVASLVVAGEMRILDNLTFYPGYDGVSVAIARGDSFALKRGMLEVTAVENSAGEIKPVAEVTVDAGAGQAISAQTDGRALLSSSNLGSSEVGIRLTRNGYQKIDGYNVPVAIDGLTLVRARMARDGTVTESEAIVSYTRPYNGQTGFPVSGPFEIGFGQPMEKDTIFNSIGLMIQNKKTGSLMAFSGSEIKNHFQVEWKNDTVLKLYPKVMLSPETRYSMLISQWEARALDGRILKNYNGMYGEFVTDVDPLPSIISTSPKNGDTNVGRNGPFMIKFDRSMRPASLYEDIEIEISNTESGSRITIDGATLKSYFSVTWKENNTVVELVPYRMLSADASYLVRLNRCGLMSESGKKVAGFEKLWGQFKTAQL